MTGIIELRQIAENDWKARYQGNYGIYTIRILTDGKKTLKFSCSCPSDYHPCKHIPMIEKAIAGQMAIGNKTEKQDALQIEHIIANISSDKLKEFCISRAKYNPEFRNAFFLEFGANAKNVKGNKYSDVIQKLLALITLDEYEDDYYNSDEEQNIDELDRWIEKAWNYLDLKQYDEAILIGKAIIEEYSQWLHENGDDYPDRFSADYQSLPFDIIEAAAEHTDKTELREYCLSEMIKKKYTGTDFYNNFHYLLESLEAKADPDSFITYQNELLAKIKDNSSRDAEIILQRIVDFYQNIGESDKAWAVIEENIQIRSFRLEAVKKRIEDKNYSAAKKLIHGYCKQNKEQNPQNEYPWRELLLDIAQKENDIPAIRKITYECIKNEFDEENYRIYKASFTPPEWDAEREKLFQHYSGKKYFSNSAADFLAAESDTGRLIKYIEKYPMADKLEKYHTILAYDYPEKTLNMFVKAIAIYTEARTGRTHYKYIYSLLKMLSKMKGGKKAAKELVTEFRVRYKNRKVMLEMLGEFS